ncbi:hypothetical protein HHK36_027575 [Tetracentron sinense]|uniref:Uncharacterized protein n=1 Tax=Tetracentron sinense TaxID=13715 RepID=A0A834YF34_TETSI|nr:hypothetical protein HHK36_027575 [Tetracentron sinense]
MCVVSLMELHKNLQTLIKRAWILHDRITDEIQNSSIGLCRFCSQHEHYCGVAEAPFVERGRLISIRDALEVVENMFMFLQRLQSRQQIDRHTALTRLEESRLFLIEKVTEHRGRALDVMKEMHACFGDRNTTFNWNLKASMAGKVKPTVHSGRKRRISGFLFSCFQILFNPWKWKKTVGVAVRFLIIAASIVSTVHFHRTRQQLRISYRKDLSVMGSIETGEMGFFQPITNSPLDVFYGRG